MDPKIKSLYYTYHIYIYIENPNDQDGDNQCSPSTTLKELDTNPEMLHQFNLGLLDPTHLNEFDTIIKTYCELLYRWGLFIKRVELLELVNEKSNDLDAKFECGTRCNECAETAKSETCSKCRSYLLYCSLCQYPVHGLSTYCTTCGHGGHYDHMIDWFRKHDDCPSACGCRCVDYL